MKKLVKLIEKAKLEKVDMEILIERFLPLIRRLAHKLPYEYQDAEQDMKLVFLELIHKISLRDMRNQEDKYLLKYIETTMNNHCFDLCHKYYRDKGREQPLEETAVILPDGVPSTTTHSAFLHPSLAPLFVIVIYITVSHWRTRP